MSEMKYQTMSRRAGVKLGLMGVMAGFLAMGLGNGVQAQNAPQAAVQPDARVIMENARMSATLTQLDEGLQGQLKKGGQKVPVTLFMKGQDIQFQFSPDNVNWKVFHMRLGDEKFSLFEMVNGKTNEFPEKQLVSAIAGTDLTYEDLAMRFFYWPDPIFEGVESVGGQDCYKIRVNKPKGVVGSYHVVYVWVHVKYGAFMRIRGHGKDGRALKEFEVEDVMQISKELWTLRKMQVATLVPETGRRASLTDVVFDAPKKAKPKGLR